MKTIPLAKPTVLSDLQKPKADKKLETPEEREARMSEILRREQCMTCG